MAGGGSESASAVRLRVAVATGASLSCQPVLVAPGAFVAWFSGSIHLQVPVEPGADASLRSLSWRPSCCAAKGCLNNVAGGSGLCGDEFERGGVGGAHDAEVSVIEGCDGGLVEAFGCGDC